MQKQFFPVVTAAVVFGCMMILAIGFYMLRPNSDTLNRHPTETRATGRCASCHYDLSPQMVEMHNHSTHAAKGVSCIDCHANQPDQEAWQHHEFVITQAVTAKNCARCHQQQYDEFLTSGHSLPAWASVHGKDDQPEAIWTRIAHKHPELVERPISPLVDQLPVSALRSGCEECHKIGRPNSDGSVGSCVDCHTAHDSSKSMAAQPESCGRCHSGVHHQGLGIYQLSKHGSIFSFLRHADEQGGAVAASSKTKRVPTCVSCHMGKIGSSHSNHDISLRLTNEVVRPGQSRSASVTNARKEMQQICMQCHSSTFVESKFKRADQVDQTIGQLIASIGEEVVRIRGSQPDRTRNEWDELDFLLFDAWHEFGKSARHGAYMGSPGHVVWQGIYQLQQIESKLRSHPTNPTPKGLGP